MKRTTLKLPSQKEKLKRLVDELAMVKEQRAAYEQREKLLLEQLKRHGIGTFEGTFFDAVTTQEWKEETDWEALFAAHRSVKALVAKYTHEKPSLVTRVRAKVSGTLEMMQ